MRYILPWKLKVKNYYAVTDIGCAHYVAPKFFFEESSSKEQFKPTDAKLFSYTGEKICSLGHIEVHIEYCGSNFSFPS